jgi:hypothetical protein
MPAKFGDVVLGKIDLAGSFETIQHHTVTFPLEQSFFLIKILNRLLGTFFSFKYLSIANTL